MVDNRSRAYARATRTPRQIIARLDRIKDTSAAEQYLGTLSDRELEATAVVLGIAPRIRGINIRNIAERTVGDRVAHWEAQGASTPNDGRLAEQLPADADRSGGDGALSILQQKFEELRDSLDPEVAAGQLEFVRTQRERLELPDEAATARIVSALESLQASLDAVHAATASAYESAGGVVAAIADAVMGVGMPAAAAGASGHAQDYAGTHR